jgi:uncharacterized protein
MAREAGQPRFEISHAEQPSETLIAGFTSFGLAGLTAANFLVDELDLVETGHISVDTLPSITPFQNGTPHHHTRLFSRSDLDITVLVNELYIPVEVADGFAASVLQWAEQHAVQEVTVLSGVPIQHGPEEHEVFFVVTDDYRDEQLVASNIRGMGRGFLNGVNGGLVAHGMDSAFRVGVFVTPVHAKVPDAEAAIRLVDVVTERYDVDIDTADLEKFASDVDQYYQDLEERIKSVQKAEEPEDRMYM